MGILVIGATFVDIKGFPFDNYLPTGRNAGRVEYVHGGVARNVVEDIANVELRPIFLSIVDDTPMGAAVVQKLQRHKVNTDYVLTRPDGMGTWLAVFDNNGDVAGSISKRPNMYPIAELLAQRGEEIFAEASSVVLEIGLDKEIVKSTLSLAQTHHVKTIALVANMSIAAERRDLLQQFDCVICNQQEAGILFLDDYAGKTPEEMRDILAQRISFARIPSMVVTMGAEGAAYASVQGEIGQSLEAKNRRTPKGFQQEAYAFTKKRQLNPSAAVSSCRSILFLDLADVFFRLKARGHDLMAATQTFQAKIRAGS